MQSKAESHRYTQIWQTEKCSIASRNTKTQKHSKKDKMTDIKHKYSEKGKIKQRERKEKV